jgi:DNA-binding NarL/FixJ family response regulator
MEINRKKMIVVNLREAPQRKRVKSDTAISMQDRHANHAPQRITARECEVVRLIARGFTNGQIAERLHISKKTVETHRTRVMNKLNLHKVTELVRYAMTAGLIDSSPKRQQ